MSIYLTLTNDNWFIVFESDNDQKQLGPFDTIDDARDFLRQIRDYIHGILK